MRRKNLAKNMLRIFLTCTIALTMMSGLFMNTALAVDTINTSVYLDTDFDGTVDVIRWTMDENVTACTYEAGDWAVNIASDFNVVITGLTCTGTDAILDIDITADADETGSTANPAISFADAGTLGSVTLTSGNMGAHASEAATDGAAPVIIALEYYDTGADGSVESIDVDFSESVTWNYGTLNQFQITNNGLTGFIGVGPSGNPTGGSGSGTSTITLTTSGTTDLTGVGAGTEPTTDYAQAPTAGDRIKDSTGNDTVAMGSTTIVDGADPAILAFDYEDLNGDGTVDNIYLQFTEAIDDDVAGMVSGDFSVTITGATTGQGAVEMVETLNVGTADDDEIDIAFTNGLTSNTNADYEINVGASKVGDAAGNFLPSLSTFDCNDSAMPILMSFTSSTGDATYGPTSGINVTATYSENISSGGVTVSLNNTVTLLALSTISTNTLAGTYTVGATGSGEDTTDLSVSAITAHSAADATPNTNTTFAVPTTNVATGSDIVIDTTAPAVNITAPLTATVVNGTAAITFTDDELTAAQCSIDNTNWVACTTTVTTLSDLTGFGALVDGAFTLYLRDTDTAGNTGTDSEAGIIKDSTAPIGYSATLDQDPINSINETAVSFTFAGAEVGATYNYSIDDVTGSGPITGSGAIATATDQITALNLSALLDETITLTVYLTDTAGNVGGNQTDTATKDSTAPTVNITAPFTTAVVNGTAAITFTDDELTAAQCSIDNTNWVACTTAVTTLSDLTGFGALVDGAFTLYLRDTDTAGNTGTDSEAGIIKDSIAPTGYSATLDQDPITSGNETAISFTFAGAEAGTTYNYSIDDVSGSGPIAGSGTIVTATDQITGIDLSTLLDETITLTVYLTDSASNVGGNQTDTATKDSTAPVLGEVTPVVTPGNNQNPSYTFSSDEAGTITYGGGCDSINTAGSLGNNTVTLDSDGAGAALAEGVYGACTVTVTDSVGNAGIALLITSFTVDTTAPILAETTPVTTPTTDATPDVDFSSDEAGAISWAGGCDSVTGSAVVSPGQTVTLDSDGAGTILADGTYNCTLTVTDAAGNASTGLALTQFIIDGAGPSVVTYSPADDSTGAAVSSNLVLTFNENVVVGTGNVVIYKASDDSVVETINIAGALVTFNGTTGVTINPASSLAFSTAYYVQIDATAVKDTIGNLYAGIADKTTWNFTTMSATTTTTTTSGGGGGGRRDIPASTPTEPTTEATTETTDPTSLVDFWDIDGHWGEMYIDDVNEAGYVEGYSDASFKPNVYITRAEASKLIASWLDSSLTDADCDASLFNDVACSEWYGKFVTYLYLQGIIEGYGEGVFNPGANISRAEALKMLLFTKNLNNSDTAGVTNPFSDNSQGAWYYNLVLIGYDLGAVQGYADGTFKPTVAITRAEFTKVFDKILLDM